MLIFAVVIILTVLCVGGYVVSEFFFDLYVRSAAKRLVSLEKKGQLSRDYGYIWQEINLNKEMQQMSSNILNGNFQQSSGKETTAGKKIHNLPSLAAVSELNKMRSLYKVIGINDRNGVPLVQLKTTHTCIKLSELDPLLIKSLLLSEDKNFYTRKEAYEFKSLVRAMVRAGFRSIISLRVRTPQGCSTIHMQVARFLLLKYDSRGYAYVERSVGRKIKEIKIAQALKALYSNDEILTVYVNHCVSAGRGMQGYYDISMGLFGVPPKRLSIARNLYLSRLVKWNRQMPGKIIRQIKLNLPLFANHFKWDFETCRGIRQALDTMTFKSNPPVIMRHSHLLDLANEYWRMVCKANGMQDRELEQMDIADPESIIRRYGRLTVTLTIDYRLQRMLERMVDGRGFSGEQTIRTDVRVSSAGTRVESDSKPPDTLRLLRVMKHDSSWIDPASKIRVHLKRMDTVVCNIRYNQTGAATLRRSCFLYKRDTLTVPGQYFAYAIMDARTQQLLAYYSRDRLGSRLSALLKNRIPNGSCVAKPIVFALAYDWGIYEPADMASDNEEIPDTCDWARKVLIGDGKPAGMVYLHSTQKDGYKVRNYEREMYGYDYIFNHLARSNNIVAVETIYRLNTNPASGGSRADNLKQFALRIDAPSLLQKGKVTGTDIYAALARICGVPVDSLNISGRRVPLPSEHYSIVLGTLELSLYEQLHLFNALYGNELVVRPAHHPSLFIQKIELAGKPVEFNDAPARVQVFDNVKNLEPVHLAMHKRLLSNAADNLGSYDICDDFGMKNRVSNFAKSGTTDDIIKPFNADMTDTLHANYGLWNATLRLRLTRAALKREIMRDSLFKRIQMLPIRYENIPDDEVMDVSLACVGECNQQYTGDRVGKALHGYVSTGLLHAYGIPCSEGFFRDYERDIVRGTPERLKYSHLQEQSDLSFLSRAFIKLRTGLGSKAGAGEARFRRSSVKGTVVLESSSYNTLLSLAPYMGKDSKRYREWVERLHKPIPRNDAKKVLNEIKGIKINNQFLKRELDASVASLLKSLSSL